MRITFSTNIDGVWTDHEFDTTQSGVRIHLSETGDDWPHVDVEVMPDGDITVGLAALDTPDSLSVLPSSSNAIKLRPVRFWKS